MDIREELKSAGVYPTGPVSAWPKSRNENLHEANGVKHATKVKAGAGKIVGGLLKNATTLMTNGRVTKAVRDERYDMCKACPAFIEDSKRCSECGCFMEAKSWIKGDPKALCPLKKWEN